MTLLGRGSGGGVVTLGVGAGALLLTVATSLALRVGSAPPDDVVHPASTAAAATTARIPAIGRHRTTLRRRTATP